MSEFLDVVNEQDQIIGRANREFEEIKNMIERGEKFHPELLFLLRKYFLE
jgi:hypothetical protein